MAAAFLPQFGCFVRSQINALDRHERLCRVDPRHGSPIFTGSRSKRPFVFELGGKNAVQGWSTSEWVGKEKKKKRRFESGMGRLRDNVSRDDED